MPHRTGAFVLVAGLVISAAGPVLSQVPRPPADPIPREAGTAFILGRVVEAGTSSPVADAIVTLSGPALGPSNEVFSNGELGGNRRVVVDAQGRFLFRDLPGGAYRLTAEAPGYVNGAYGQSRPLQVARTLDVSRVLNLADGEKHTGAAIELSKYASISGVVVDEAGEPLVGVPVNVMTRIVTWGGPAMQAGPIWPTDDRGMYRADVTPGDYVVAVLNSPATVPASAVEEYRAAAAESPNAARVFALRLGLGGGPTINAETTGVRVGDLLLTSSGVRNAALPPATLAPDGRLFVYPTTYYPAATTATQAMVVSVASGEERTGVDLRLAPQPVFRVSGRLVGPPGAGERVSVRLIPMDPTMNRTSPATIIDEYRTLTDAEGRFTFLGVVPDQYVLRALNAPAGASMQAFPSLTPSGASTVVVVGSPAPAEPTWWAIETVAVGDRDVDGLEVALRPGARFSGRVVFDGARPAPPATRLQRVTVNPRGVPGTSGALAAVSGGGRVGADGRFVTPELVPGPYQLSVSNVPPGWVLRSIQANGQDAADVPVELRSSGLSDVVVTFTDRVTRLGGVARGANGEPAASATVVLFPVDRALWRRAGLANRRTQTTGPGRDGAYEFNAVAPGDYFIAAVADAADDFSDPAVLARLIPLASRVSVAEGETATQDVRAVVLR